MEYSDTPASSPGSAASPAEDDATDDTPLADGQPAVDEDHHQHGAEVTDAGSSSNDSQTLHRCRGGLGFLLMLINCMLVLPLCGLTRGEVLMTTNPDMQQDTRHALETCALAMITLATHNGIVKNDNGEIKHVMHVKADTYDFVLTEEIMGDESMGKHWLGHPQSVDCREEGIVIIKAKCTKTRCQNEQTGQIMTVGEAEQKVTLLKSRRKRDLEKLKTSQWDTNMFQQWIMYSAQAMFDAKKQKRRDCIACYNAKRIPQVHSIPGSELGDCPDSTKCFALCALFMAGGLPGWSKDKKICPTLHHAEHNDIVGAIPPVVHKPANIIFPYCIA